jgi:hypothetical protein
MAQSPLRLLKRCVEFLPQEAVTTVPGAIRGVYVLYKQIGPAKQNKFCVVYVGMSASGETRGIRRRLAAHRKSKGELWTHFSVFQVWDNIRNEEIRELEGLFRHIYRKDPAANRLNVARGFKPMRRIRHAEIREWD